MAAADWAVNLTAPVRDVDDTASMRLDRRLQRAAVAYTGKLTDMAKRGYSREFTPQTERRVRFEVDRIPPTLMDAVKAKAKREGVSLRALTLRLWKDWTTKETAGDD